MDAALHAHYGNAMPLQTLTYMAPGFQVPRWRENAAGPKTAASVRIWRRTDLRDSTDIIQVSYTLEDSEFKPCSRAVLAATQGNRCRHPYTLRSRRLRTASPCRPAAAATAEGGPDSATAREIKRTTGVSRRQVVATVQ